MLPRRPVKHWRCHFVPALLVVHLLVACTLPPRQFTDIKGDDRAVVLPAGRINWVLLDRGARSATPGSAEPVAPAPRRDEFKLLLELDASQGSGGFTQDLVDVADDVSLGGQSFNGPEDVEVDFELFRASAAVRAAKRFQNNLGVDGFLGIGMSDLDITLRQTALSDSDSIAAYGPLLGVTLSYWLLDPLRIFVEGSANVGWTSGFNGVNIIALDMGASVRLGRNVRLTAGWRQLHYDAEFDPDEGGNDTRSDLTLELSGPMLALWLSL